MKEQAFSPLGSQLLFVANALTQTTVCNLLPTVYCLPPTPPSNAYFLCLWSVFVANLRSAISDLTKVHLEMLETTGGINQPLKALATVPDRFPDVQATDLTHT